MAFNRIKAWSQIIDNLVVLHEVELALKRDL